jgi:hypothetical protein
MGADAGAKTRESRIELIRVTAQIALAQDQGEKQRK